MGAGSFGVVGNLVGLVLAGWWLALGHLVTELILDHRHSFCLTGLYASFGPDLDLPGVAANSQSCTRLPSTSGSRKSSTVSPNRGR